MRQLDKRHYELRFIGQSLHLKPVAPVSIRIDAQPPQRYNPAPDSAFISIAEGLVDGEHRAMIESDQAPQSFLVSRNPPLPWLWNLIPLVFIAALARLCRP